MSIESAIVNLIKNNSSVNTLISNRLFPIVVPQGQSGDSIVYQQIAENEPISCEGGINLIDSRFQFTCFSDSHTGCIALAEALRSALQDTSGTYDGVVIAQIQILSRGDVPAIDEKAEQLSRYGKFLDVMVSYEN